MSSWEERVASLEIRLRHLKGGLEDVVGDVQTLRAPCTGVVLDAVDEGTVVAQGTPLVTLACDTQGARVAELTIGQSGIGKVHEGDRVDLSFAACPHARCGMRTGTVTQVGPITGPSLQVPVHVAVDTTPGSWPACSVLCWWAWWARRGCWWGVGPCWRPRWSPS